MNFKDGEAKSRTTYLFWAVYGRLAAQVLMTFIYAHRNKASLNQGAENITTVLGESFKSGITPNDVIVVGLCKEEGAKFSFQKPHLLLIHRGEKDGVTVFLELALNCENAIHSRVKRTPSSIFSGNRVENWSIKFQGIHRAPIVYLKFFTELDYDIGFSPRRILDGMLESAWGYTKSVIVGLTMTSERWSPLVPLGASRPGTLVRTLTCVQSAVRFHVRPVIKLFLTSWIFSLKVLGTWNLRIPCRRGNTQ